MAKTKGIRALEVEKQRREAEAKQRREQQVSLLSDVIERPRMVEHACDTSNHPWP